MFSFNDFKPKKMSIIEIIYRAISMDMLLWKRIPATNNTDVFEISINCLTVKNNIVNITKDGMNNLNIIGLESSSEDIKTLYVTYKISSSVFDAYAIQDIIASELIQKKYMVEENKKFSNMRIVTLCAV